MDGVARYRPGHDVKRLPWSSRLFVPSIKYAAVKFVFNCAIYRVCDVEVFFN